MEKIKNEWIDLEQYLTYLAQICSEEITVFHQLPWLKALSRGFSCKLQFLRTYNSNLTLALTPFMIQRKGPFSLIGSPLSGMYTESAGPVFEKDTDEALTNKIVALQHEYISSGKHYIEWGLTGADFGTNHWTKSLLEKEYTLDLKPSLLIDLSMGETTVWTGFKSRARNMIRKAEKSNLRVKNVAPDEEWINQYYNLLRDTFEKQGLAVPHPLSFFQQIPSLVDEGLAICMDVKLEGRIIAGSIFIIDKRRMIYLSGVATRDGMRLAAPSLIQWSAIKLAISNDIKHYDLGGLGIESIDKFKRSFGGSEIFHTRLVFSSKIFKLIEPFGRWLHKKGLLSLGN